MHVLVLVGSSRPESFNARLADLAVAELPTGTEVARFDLATLPFYDEVADARGELGASAEAFRAAVRTADAIILASPAYNGTMSAMAKNAIDIASRPRDNAPLHDKPVLLLTAVYTPGADTRVLEHLTLSVTIAGGRPVGSGVGVSHHFEAFDASGLVDEDAARALKAAVADLVAPVSVG